MGGGLGTRAGGPDTGRTGSRVSLTVIGFTGSTPSLGRSRVRVWGSPSPGVSQFLSIRLLQGFGTVPSPEPRCLQPRCPVGESL